MTTTTPTRPRAQALRQAAVRATLAPSVHNTQPWRFVISPDTLEVHADRARQLRVLDPSGRQLLISCGCALLNARAALAAAGYDPVVRRFPDPARPALLARVRVGTEPVDWQPLSRLAPFIEHRQSNRRRFSDDPVPPDVVHDLVAAAASEHAQLFEITLPEHRAATARLTQEADRNENADPAYRAELRAWTSADANRRDGVPAMAVPHVNGRADDDIPIRDFDTSGMGWLPGNTRSTANQCLLLLGTSADQPAAWLRAGEALERVLLEATLRGYAASLFTQVIEVPRTRYLLRKELGLDMNPHVLLRIGHAPLTPASRRRRLVDVLSESGDLDR
jgi:nitroreductase